MCPFRWSSNPIHLSMTFQGTPFGGYNTILFWLRRPYDTVIEELKVRVRITASERLATSPVLPSTNLSLESRRGWVLGQDLASLQAVGAIFARAALGITERP